MMMLHQMCLNAFKLLAMQMDERTAFLAFAVKAGLLRTVGGFADIFIAGGRVGVDDIFIYETFVDHSVQLSVDGGHTDWIALGMEIRADIIDRKMLSGN